MIVVIVMIVTERAGNGYVCGLLSIASCQLHRRSGCGYEYGWRCGCEDDTENVMCLIYEYAQWCTLYAFPETGNISRETTSDCSAVEGCGFCSFR